jgi:1-aminocyclopropane-1-carboxylate deaminase/D-cysteine desulfhydrase-like pyridoxal-dependent ACC family enzyme
MSPSSGREGQTKLTGREVWIKRDDSRCQMKGEGNEEDRLLLYSATTGEVMGLDAAAVAGVFCCGVCVCCCVGAAAG